MTTDTELVIKIPDRVHYGIEIGITVNGSNASQIVLDAVKNGTPLPKGHGRLIDADETLKKHCVDLCREKPSCHEDCLIYDLFHLAPTIIEADKGE